MGAWLGGFARKVGICSLVAVELWAVLWGLDMAWDKGSKKVILKVDSQLVAQNVKAPRMSMDMHMALVQAIKERLSRRWQIVIHTYREGNAVADWLANEGLQSGSDNAWLEDPPHRIYYLLFQDIVGVAYPRFVVPWFGLLAPIFTQKKENVNLKSSQT